MMMMMMKMMRHFHGDERLINLENTVGFMARYVDVIFFLTRFNNPLQTSTVCSNLI